MEKNIKKNSTIAQPKLEDGKWKVRNHTAAEACNEELFFEMKDSNHEFSLGLSIVLNCLSIAEEEGFVPALPKEWWIQIRRF